MCDKPRAIDMTLCTSTICKNKCKRHEDFWTPNEIQSYINPSIETDEEGNIKPCKARMK